MTRYGRIFIYTPTLLGVSRNPEPIRTPCVTLLTDWPRLRIDGEFLSQRSARNGTCKLCTVTDRNLTKDL